ncbi:hypothetical protein [Methanococcus maripaludis]|nr:hypothetical protein [Methanococcus maripaludis]
MTVEKYYTPRPVVFTNALSLNAYMSLSGVGFSWLYGYSNLGLAFGIIAYLSYLSKSKSGAISKLSLFFSSYLIGAITIWLYFYYEWNLPGIIALGLDLAVLGIFYKILPKNEDKKWKR